MNFHTITINRTGQKPRIILRAELDNAIKVAANVCLDTDKPVTVTGGTESQNGALSQRVYSDALGILLASVA